MNATFQPAASTRPSPAASLPRREPRSRDFGIGYGSSSGYFSQRRYAGSPAASRFRCS